MYVIYKNIVVIIFSNYKMSVSLSKSSQENIISFPILPKLKKVFRYQRGSKTKQIIIKSQQIRKNRTEWCIPTSIFNHLVSLILFEASELILDFSRSPSSLLSIINYVMNAKPPWSKPWLIFLLTISDSYLYS